MALDAAGHRLRHHLRDSPVTATTAPNRAEGLSRLAARRRRPDHDPGTRIDSWTAAADRHRDARITGSRSSAASAARRSSCFLRASRSRWRPAARAEGAARGEAAAARAGRGLADPRPRVSLPAPVLGRSAAARCAIAAQSGHPEHHGPVDAGGARAVGAAARTSVAARGCFWRRLRSPSPW